MTPGEHLYAGVFALIVLGGLVTLGVLAYLFPAVVASVRKHHNATAILCLNFFLGWTFLGWVVALVWALTTVRERDVFRVVPAVRYAGAAHGLPDDEPEDEDKPERGMLPVYFVAVVLVGMLALYLMS